MQCTVREIVGENAITLDDGQGVYDQIEAALSVGEVVELDFSGVVVFASPFFNAAIGRLLRDHSPDDLARLRPITGLDSPGQDLLRRVIESGKRYYASADYREAQSRVLRELAEAD
ncbi:MAG: STAS-like domain-containing protein [Rhodopirellula sp.]|nr:STAS-like domain-containing protein [Rhodopirellula sp.]